jgi:3-hydroxybutyryl-CoA dehydrogenase
MKESNKKVIVAGAGIMGHGISAVFAMGGYKVAQWTRRQETLDQAKELIQSSLQTLVKGGLIKKSDIPKIKGRITFTLSMEEACADSELAIETVVEKKEVKEEIFAQFDKFCPPKTILASNTTALNIFDFIKTSRQDKLCIAHWYTPPILIPLVDVVKGPETSDETIKTVAEMIKNIGQYPLVLKKYVSGYVVSKLQIALLREIMYLLDNDIVSPEDLDNAVITGLTIRQMVLGVVKRMDYGGLDLTYKNMTNPAVINRMTPMDYKPVKLEQLVKDGHYGVKTLKGFYDYTGKTVAQVNEERDLKMIKMLKAWKDMEGIK